MKGNQGWCLTFPDGSGHWTGGAFLACYWSVPPKWSPMHRKKAREEVSESAEEVGIQSHQRQTETNQPRPPYKTLLLMHTRVDSAQKQSAGFIVNYNRTESEKR